MLVSLLEPAFGRALQALGANSWLVPAHRFSLPFADAQPLGAQPAPAEPDATARASRSVLLIGRDAVQRNQLLDLIAAGDMSNPVALVWPIHEAGDGRFAE